MDDETLLLARIKELSSRASQQNYLTHTGFLSLSEQNLFFRELEKEHLNPKAGRIGTTSFLLLGGHEDSDRKVLFFLPEYLPKEEFLASYEEEETISCLLVEPKAVKYADTLTHRDYLGALMHLGYERNQFGDILSDGTKGYIFLLKANVEDIQANLLKIKHTMVKTTLFVPHLCPYHPRFKEKTLTLASVRLDALIGEVFSLSRRAAQEAIGKENVFVDGLTLLNNAYHPKENQRISVRGKGKFIYLGISHETRRGRIAVKVKIYD